MKAQLGSYMLDMRFNLIAVGKDHADATKQIIQELEGVVRKLKAEGIKLTGQFAQRPVVSHADINVPAQHGALSKVEATWAANEGA